MQRQPGDGLARLDQLPAVGEPADRWAEDEAQAKRDADDDHARGTVFAGGDVGRDGGGGGDVPGHDAAERTTRHEQREAPGEHPDQIRQHDAGECENKCGTAAVSVRVRPPDRREDELQKSVQRTQHAAEQRRDGVFVVAGELAQPSDQRANQALLPIQLEVIIEHRREERKNNREPDHVDEHGQEHDVQGGLLHPAKPRANKCRRRGPRSLGKPVHITTPFPEASMRLIKAVAWSCSRS